MQLYYDFHIHTALSPCGDNDMTPNNIVNMALIKGLNAIAVTDHNSCKNVRACMELGREGGLLVIPGMELETSEEIHVICLFPTIEQAIEFDRQVESHLSSVKNKPDVFGRQYILDEADEIQGEIEGLLITATSIDLSQGVSLVHSCGGVAIPAHIDKGANSVLSNLGLMPEDLDINYVELSRRAAPDFMDANRRRFFKEYKTLHNSDAHYLGDISEPVNSIIIDGETPCIAGIIDFLKKG